MPLLHPLCLLCRYERALVQPELHGLGDELLAKFQETERGLLTVRQPRLILQATLMLASLCAGVLTCTTCSRLPSAPAVAVRRSARFKLQSTRQESTTRVLRPPPPPPQPQVMKHSRLLSSSSTAFLQQKLQLRAPYVAPLNILQVGGWVGGGGGGGGGRGLDGGGRGGGGGGYKQRTSKQHTPAQTPHPTPVHPPTDRYRRCRCPALSCCAPLRAAHLSRRLCRPTTSPGGCCAGGG